MRNVSKHLCALAAVLVCVLSFTVAARAGSFDINPTRLIFSTLTSGDVVITNVGQAPLRLSVRAYKWTQDGEHVEQLAVTDDVAYFPKVFTLVPSASQRVRVGVLAAPQRTEQAYRIVVTQLPAFEPSGSAAGTNIQFLSRLDIPVLLSGTSGSDGAVPHIARLQTKGDRVGVYLDNAGNAHLEQSAIALIGKDAQGRVLWETQQRVFYVLAHSGIRVNSRVPEPVLERTRSITAQWNLPGDAQTRTFTVGR